jgi:cyclophilin family peptidyl-prolyl cis-trans isomerase
MNGDHEAAVEHYDKAAESGKLEPAMERIRAEAVRRGAEAKADDLPRVSLKTSKGEIVLELFENEAPNTVANFLSLVDRGYYNGSAFHRVIRGFVAEAGIGKERLDYSIPCECYGDDYRRHFAGSLSMANVGRDTGESRFFIAYSSLPNFDGKYTVFGRVIEGMDVAKKLNATEPQPQGERDRIIKATILRDPKQKRELEKLPRR